MNSHKASRPQGLQAASAFKEIEFAACLTEPASTAETTIKLLVNLSFDSSNTWGPVQTRPPKKCLGLPVQLSTGMRNLGLLSSWTWRMLHCQWWVTNVQYQSNSQDVDLSKIGAKRASVAGERLGNHWVLRHHRSILGGQQKKASEQRKSADPCHEQAGARQKRNCKQQAPTKSWEERRKKKKGKNE